MHRSRTAKLIRVVIARHGLEAPEEPLEAFSFRQFVEDCYRENARRMSEFDPDLMQPRLLPSIADMAVRGLRRWECSRPHLRRTV